MADGVYLFFKKYDEFDGFERFIDISIDFDA